MHNKAGAVVNVVHQYDRFPDLQKYLFHKVKHINITVTNFALNCWMCGITYYSSCLCMQYVDWVKTGDLAAEWADEPACKAYSYQADTDLFKGKIS